MSANNGPPPFGMPPQNQFGGPGGRYPGPRPPFGHDQGPEPRGFNPRYMPPGPPRQPGFQPRGNNMRKYRDFDMNDDS